MVEKNSKFDVIILGGGPAGLSAMLWCADLGMNAILIEKNAEFGGQLLQIHNTIKNYLGVETANGRALRDTFMQQIDVSKTSFVTGADVIDANLAKKIVTLTDGRIFSGGAIFLATGVRRRKLSVPGEEEFRGRGILESGVKAVEEMKGKTVLIVGGGDAALENAVVLSRTADKVYVVHRRASFSARAEFVSSAAEKENIHLVLDTVVTEIMGTQYVETAAVKHLTLGSFSQIPTDAVLIRIGVQPNTELFRDQLDLDAAGYIRIDSRCATSLERVFAGGDVANSTFPTISSAAGNGSAAVKVIYDEVSSVHPAV
jgi:thioredoxin reductase (NADPH)